VKIAIVVQGRFHAFDLAQALTGRGHDVTVFTNYPVWAARRFGLEADCVRSFPLHGVASRAAGRAGRSIGEWWEPIGHRLFGRWAARELARDTWDVIHCWSGVSEEILRSASARHALTLLMRGSSHVVTQRRLLDEESARSARPLDRPSDWMIARETREYELADRINVLSTFSKRSFEDEGMAPGRLALLPLGVNVGVFRPSAAVEESRRQRILSGAPLRVLYVGLLSFRKGLLDLARAIEHVAGGNFHFTLVGQQMPEAAGLVASLAGRADLAGKLPQSGLPSAYAAADLFLFPTIEDGFPVVLAQAKAAGLPIITTPNGAGTDLVHPGRDGWIVPIRDADAIVDRLRWCDANREALAAMIAGRGRVPSRSWADVAADFERICLQAPPMNLRERRTIGA
jgi:glycosyltransferase involved in cell wall biosynthesis